MPNVLQFVPRQQPENKPIEDWEKELVFDLLDFASSHGLPLSLDSAVSMSQAIVHGQPVITFDV